MAISLKIVPWAISVFMLKYLLIMMVCSGPAYGSLAGGRPNAISGGTNAFAGIVNPANAVWIPDRLDAGAHWLHQKSSFNNHDNNPNFILGKANTSYHANDLYTFDAAITKRFESEIGCQKWEWSLSLASYNTPSNVKIRTQEPIPISGTTPIRRTSNTEVVSAIFSLKLGATHSIGVSLDYFRLSYLRCGNQRADNPLRSVSPGHVTNNGMDHSQGLGVGLGWRWNITERLDFGAAWAKKSACGQFRKYRGYEPYHAKNYIPQTFGAGLGYRFTDKVAGRVEVLWSNLSNMPNANDVVLPNGTLNPSKRGSNKSPGAGLRDATYLSVGLGYRFSSTFSMGAGFSHRIRLPRKSSNILVHPYMLQTVYNVLSVGANFIFKKNELFFGYSYGFRNQVSGYMPAALGGGRFTAEKNNSLLSISWGYRY